MNPLPFLAGSITVGTTFILSILVNMHLRRKTQYAISRLFLKKDETVKTLKSMALGTFIFAVGRIIASFYSLGFIPQNVYFASAIVSGESLAICFLYTFYKILRITMPTRS